MTTDRLTTYLGIATAALHQYAMVGLIPADAVGWAQTAVSPGLGIFGYFIKK